MSTDPMFAILVVAYSIAIGSPFWIPLVFAAYAYGRKQYGLGLLIILVAAEALAIVLSLFVLRISVVARE
jgi:hypothetical protein